MEQPFEYPGAGRRRTADFTASPTYQSGDSVREPSGKIATAIDETPELDALLNRLFSTADELARSEARLSGFADRLGGPVPECNAASSDHAYGTSGLVSRVDALHSSLTATLIDINTTISRLERLA